MSKETFADRAKGAVVEQVIDIRDCGPAAAASLIVPPPVRDGVRRLLSRSQRLSAGPERSCGLAISSKVKLRSARPRPTSAMPAAGAPISHQAPTMIADEFCGVVEHRAPGDAQRIAEAEIFERRLGDDGVDDAADDVDADQRHEIGQDLDEDHPPVRLADHAGGHDEFAVAAAPKSASGSCARPKARR